MQKAGGPKSLTDMLDGIDAAAADNIVSIADILDEFGDRAITPFILLTALLMVSPLSAIPGTPTISALIIVALSLQALFGRRRLWLPGWIKRRQVAADRLRSATGWMRRPCAFLDRHAHRRLTVLTRFPLRSLSLLPCVVVPLFWPFLELLPMVTSIGAFTVALFAFGLFMQDGLYVILGFVLVAVLIVVAGQFLG